MKSSTRASALGLFGCGVLSFTLAGCGGGDSPSSTSTSTSSNSPVSSSPAPSAPSAPQAAANPGGGMHGAAGGGSAEMAGAEMSEGGFDSSGEGGYPGAPGQYNPGGPQTAGPIVPSRPEDPADWNEKQLREAIEERDKKAPEAISAFSARIEGDADATGTLVSYLPILLEPPRKPTPVARNAYGGGQSYPGAPGALGAPGDGGEGYIPPEDFGEMYETPGGEMYGVGGGGANKLTIDQQIAQALIESIIGSRTLVGYLTARGLLKGEVPVGQPEDLVAGWVLSSLMKSFSGSTADPARKILLQSLTQGELLRPGAGDFDAGKLEKSSLVKHAADAISIIDGLMGLSTMELLNLKRQNNYMAGGPGDSGEMYESAGFEGAYPGGPGGGVPKIDVKPEIPPIPKDFPITDFTQTQSFNASRYLWSDELIEFVSERMGESETLLKTPELVLLAGQIPHSTTRQGLKEFLEKNWELTDEWTRNPAPLITDKVFEKYMRDPGLLVTLKSLPREQSTQQGGNQYGEGAEGPGGESGVPPRRTANRDRGKSVDSPEQIAAKQAWFDVTQKVMLAWMDRATKGENVGNGGDTLADLPFKLHRDAEPSRSFRMELTCGHGETAEVTKLSYVRIELPSDISPNQGKQIARHYDSAMKRGEEYVILGKSGMWYDWVSTDKQTGEIVSVDVLLSQNGARKISGPQQGPPGGGGGAASQLAVEILVIRVSDPSAKLPAGVVSQQ